MGVTQKELEDALVRTRYHLSDSHGWGSRTQKQVEAAQVRTRYHLSDSHGWGLLRNR